MFGKNGVAILRNSSGSQSLTGSIINVNISLNQFENR